MLSELGFLRSYCLIVILVKSFGKTDYFSVINRY
jgi:hypothetical protein